MKLEQNHIDQIRVAFSHMESTRDLLNLLNEGKPMIYGKKTIPFELNQLTWFANPKLSGKRYLEFKIKKKSGSLRSIHAPVNGLKAIQKALALILGCVYEPNQSATGFLWGKSILDNAQIHVGSRYVYNVDLKDFFPSIDQARVWKCLQLKPFNLSSTSPRKDFQQDDSTSFSFWNLPKRSFDVDINELIWKISYTGYFLNKGNYCVNLKDGGKILYKIEVVENSNSQGIITVFIQKSDFKIVPESYLYAYMNQVFLLVVFRKNSLY